MGTNGTGFIIKVYQCTQGLFNDDQVEQTNYGKGHPECGFSYE